MYNSRRVSSSVRRRILVVEDSSTMRSFVASALEQDYEVVTAPSGFEALRILPRSSFHLVITDIYMPDIHGFELIRTLKRSARYHDTPLIAISTDAKEEIRQKALALGANEYLVKPFSPETLRDVCSRYLEV